MKFNSLVMLSALAIALFLLGCDGMPTDQQHRRYNSGGVFGDTSRLPGVNNQALAEQISAKMGIAVIVQVLNRAIQQDTTLVAQLDGIRVMYAIDGALTVGGAYKNNRHAPVILTLEPGVVLFGHGGGDYVVVHRDSKIHALGTAKHPIIMTSLQDVLAQPTMAGQWGGLVLLGNAPSNQCPTDGTECALQVEGAAPQTRFGGDNWQDDSGILRYVVIKYAGFEIAPDNELNGITFAGVGSGTLVDYVQVHASADDGVEFFGGAVNAKHLVLTGNKDDSVDWDHGYVGKLQYVYVEHDKNAGEANRGIEGGNDVDNPGKQPQSNPTIANMTIIGNNFDTADKDSEGIYLREGTGAQLFNIAIIGSDEMGECFEVENTPINQTHTQDGTISIVNSLMGCKNDENFKHIDSHWWTEQSGNLISHTSMFDADGQPLAGSPLLNIEQNGLNEVAEFFASSDFIGALDGHNDWRQSWAFGFGGGEVSSAPVPTHCPNGTMAITSLDGHTTTCQLSGRYSDDLTLTAGNLYALDGAVFIGNDNVDSATLNIGAGVTVFGREGSDYLVISRGSKINANGSAAEPIVFTSSQDLLGQQTGPGQWGGIVLLGNAPTNKCPVKGVECAVAVEGVAQGADYGGYDWQDSSGILRYVVVRYAGYQIAPDNELNGITFAAVGAGTHVEYIQVHQNADDGVEFFGGTVNAKYLVLTGNMDDSLDWDDGYSGKLQFVLIKPDDGAHRAIEGDNGFDGQGGVRKPQSYPIISHMTIIGHDSNDDDKQAGVYLGSGSLANLSNSVIVGPEGMGTCFAVADNADTDWPKIKFSHSVMACENANPFENIPPAWFTRQAYNRLLHKPDVVLDGIFTIIQGNSKDWSKDAFFDNANHIGAVTRDNHWTAGWTVGL